MSDKKTKPQDSQTTKNYNDVIAAEKKRLNLEGKQTSGFAISGGGIRSASFGLGVMQSLVANNQLEKMDYMSTVSGGGYLGSALTWALKQGGKDAGTTPDKFPIGKRGAAARGPEGKMQYDANDNRLLDFIRQHSSYLTPTGSLDIVSFAGVVVRSMIVSLFVYFCFLVILMTATEWGHFFQNDFVSRYSPEIFKINGKAGVFIPLAALSMVIYFLWSFLYSLHTFVSSDGVLNEYKWFIRSQQIIGGMWKFAATCVILGILPFITEVWIPDLKQSILTGGTSTLFGAIVGLWQYKKAQRRDTSSGPVSNLMIYLGAFGLMYGLVLLAFIASGIFFAPDCLHIIHPKWLAVFVVITIMLGVFVNLNLVGPHRVWRDRLMEAFMPNKEAVKKNEWQPAAEADAALMEDMCDEYNPRPYHIVNTNIILANSPQVKFSGRGGDNFIISPLFCGCDATGWRTTKTFHKNGSRGITLASAMATSAAALNPNAGVSGEGATRNTIVSILLSTLNLRLGYWVSNPALNLWPFPPNFFTPGLTSEITKEGFTETDRRILLSDGGHFENLAIYELIRRKVNLIVLSDGGADPSFNFDDLANAVEKVRVDFGAKISFKNGYGLDGILPGTKGPSEYDKKYAIAERGFAIADITYEDGTTGTLVYVKLAMIAGLATDVYSYKGVNPSFPHQSTADQFFDEKQFEAYRELGYYVGWQMMESEEGVKLFRGIG